MPSLPPALLGGAVPHSDQQVAPQLGVAPGRGGRELQGGGNRLAWQLRVPELVVVLIYCSDIIIGCYLALLLLNAK